MEGILVALGLFLLGAIWGAVFYKMFIINLIKKGHPPKYLIKLGMEINPNVTSHTIDNKADKQ